MRTIAGAIALCLLGLAAPQAHAGSEDYSTIKGGCFFDTLNDITPGGLLGGQDVWQGVLYSQTVLVSPTYGNVVNASVSCVLKVNGVEQLRVGPQWGSGAVLFAEPLTFTAAPTDIVSLCTLVDFTSDDTPTVLHCPDTTTMQVIPQLLVELIDFVVGVADYYVLYPANQAIDTTVCSVLRTLAPGAGPVVIEPGGDVYVGGHDPEDFFWDCYPYVDYDYPPPSPPVPPDLGQQVQVPTGGGWDDGDTGLLALLTPRTTAASYPPADPDPHHAGAVCAFHRDGDGTVHVQGHATTAAAGTTAVHCRLLDGTGATVYDRTVTGDGSVAELAGTVTGVAGKISVCTEGTGTWGTATATTGFHCRYA
jgi:hypothetical protein